MTSTTHSTEKHPHVPPHRPVAVGHRRGSLHIDAYELGGHQVWVATDEAGVVALAGSRKELDDVLALTGE